MLRRPLTLALRLSSRHSLNGVPACKTRFALNGVPACKTRFAFTTSAARRQSADHDEFTAATEEERKRREEERRFADEDEATRDKILDAALDKVPEMGWTKEALIEGAKSAGFPSVTSGLASDGPVDLVKRHMELSDRKLEGIMRAEVEEKKAKGERVRIRDFTRRMVEQRLRMNTDLVRNGRWAEAVALLSRPDIFPSYLDAELRLMDAIWHHCGDTSTDINWYTKRLSLALIYKSTELFMLEDKSADFSETWAFLDRRFQDELSIASFLAASKESRRVLQGAFLTLQNVVGMPRK